MITNHGVTTVKLCELLKDEKAKEKVLHSLSSYPLYTPQKVYDLIPTREQLNEKLLDHYKYREIGFETPGRFLDELRITMCEIMPYYNERFKTVEIMAELENPFDNVDITETFSETNTGQTTNKTEGAYTDNKNISGTGETNTNTTNSSEALEVGSTLVENSNTENTSTNGTDTNKTVKSDTPQDELSITAKNIDSVSYANDVTWNKAEKTETGNTTNTGTTETETTTNNTASSEGSESTTSEHTQTEAGSGENSVDSTGTASSETERTITRKGNHGVNTYAHDMNEFRTAIIDVVNEIINDRRINDLFMLVW